MTLTSETVKVEYNGDDSTTDFDVTFIFWDVDDFEVILIAANGTETPWTRGSQYTVARDELTGPTTGTINVETIPIDYTPATGEKLLIKASLPNAQDTALPRGGSFPSSVVEQELDQVVRMVQQEEEQLGRSLKYPASEAFTRSAELPGVALRASSFLAFDSDGEPIAAAGTSADLGPVSSFVDTLLDDADADAFIETLADGATAETAPVVGDLILLSDASENDGRKMTLANLLKVINVLTADASPDAAADYLLTYDADATAAKRVLISNLFPEGLGAHHAQNVGFTSTVAASANTIALKGRDLSAPSATNSVDVAFQNATIATGDYAVVRTTAATSIVIPNGATLGFTTSEDGYVYIYGINNAGALELAVSKKALWQEHQLASTTAISAAADSDNVLYSTTARTDVPVRLLGRQRITTGATPGQWGTGPTELVVWSPAMKKTGDIIQHIPFSDTAFSSGTTVIPFNDTIPQNTEGDQYLSNAITPTSSINELRIESQAQLSHTGTSVIMVSALFQDSTADALAASWAAKAAVASAFSSVVLSHHMIAGTVSQTTFKIRCGSDVAGTTNFNGQAAARKLGGALTSRLDLWEIQA